MNTKRVLIAILLVIIATIVCIMGSQKREPEPPKTIKLVFMQEHSMVDYGAAETYVTDKIDEKKAKVAEYEKRKAEYQERSKAAHEEYLAALEQQRKAAQVAQTYSDPAPSAPTDTAPSSDGYLGNYELTAYVWTGNPCANGNYPADGYTIASNSLPLGTKVYIEGLGERVVEDKGGMSSNVIDVYIDGSTQDALNFGRQSADVYIVEE